MICMLYHPLWCVFSQECGYSTSWHCSLICVLLYDCPQFDVPDADMAAEYQYELYYFKSQVGCSRQGSLPF